MWKWQEEWPQPEKYFKNEWEMSGYVRNLNWNQERVQGNLRYNF